MTVMSFLLHLMSNFANISMFCKYCFIMDFVVIYSCDYERMLFDILFCVKLF